MAKILLVDDDPDVRTVMSKVLHNHGYEVDTASCQKDALAKLEEELPFVILLDVLLSGADGRELCREIKTNKKTEGIHIIMFSGHPGAAPKFESYGADDFIAKPVDVEALLEKLTWQMKTVK
jgi:CheY-like chemotaxis protein